MRNKVFLLIILFSFISTPAQTRVNPIRVITDQSSRPEVMIVFDTSGSMQYIATADSTSGSDCGGERSSTSTSCTSNFECVDYCGDGACTGTETSSNCSTDCKLTGNTSPYNSGISNSSSGPKCSTTYKYISRMMMIKRVLRTLLPDMKEMANFGLVTFRQTGYFRYYKAATHGLTSKQTIFLSKLEMEQLGAWDTTNIVPRTSFACNNVTICNNGNYCCANTPWAGTGTQYALLSSANNTSALPNPAGCVSSCPSGTCSTSPSSGSNLCTASSCTALVCPPNLGVTSLDSLYARADNSTIERRFAFSTAGDTPAGYTADGYQWIYKGSYYTYVQMPILTGTYTGGSGQPASPTAYKGPQYIDGYGTWVHTRFNTSASPVNDSYSSSAASIWVPLETDQSQAAQTNNVFKIISLMNMAYNGGLIGDGGTPTGPAIGAAHQLFIHRQQGNCTDTSVRASNSTYSFPSTADGFMQYTYGQAGYCPFSTADDMAPCRKRYVLVLTDGEYNSGINGDLAARNLYNDGDFTGNPIQTMVVGLPGLPSSAKTKLNDMADNGYDGIEGNNPTCCQNTQCTDVVNYECDPNCLTCTKITSPSLGTVTHPCTDPNTKCQNAYFAKNESQLVDAVRSALYTVMKGDYTTSQAGISTSNPTSIPGDIALISSTDFPGWKGHFRAYNIKTDPGVDPEFIWDAAAILNNQNYYDRKLYTGLPGTNNTSSAPPIPFFDDVDPPGTVNSTLLTQIPIWWQRFTGSAIPTALTANNNELLIDMIRWAAGKKKGVSETAEREWKLGPIVRSTPATLGAPPQYRGVHLPFELNPPDRPRLIYVASNDGLLHAFYAPLKDASENWTGGNEAFAYFPPNLFPQLYTLYQQNGQKDDPKQFVWLLASSPRIEDIPLTSDGLSWKTQLLQTMGPGDNEFVVLDITTPIGGDPPVPTFSILAHSTYYNSSFNSHLGETWSVPVMFWEEISPNPANYVGHAVMGSGYCIQSGTPATCSIANQGYWYNYFDSLWSNITPAAYEHTYGGAWTDYALLTDSVAAIDTESNRRVIASYQGDLYGRILRYALGKTANTPFTVINGGSANPFYFSPAVYHRGSNKVTLAAISGMIDEENPSPDYISPTIYMRTEIDGAFPSGNPDTITCSVTDICNCLTNRAGACDGISTIASTTKPITYPLLFENMANNNAMEAFYLVYEPPQAACMVGNSYLIRVSSESGTPQLIKVKKYENVRATGMTIAGGGKDMIITTSGKGEGQTAGVIKAMDNMTGTAVITPPPWIESVTEVR